MLAMVRTASVVALAAVDDLHLDSFNKFKIRYCLLKVYNIFVITGNTVVMHVIIWIELNLTEAMFPIRSQLIGSVAHTGVGAKCVVAAMSTVGLFYFTFVDICDKNMFKKCWIQWRNTSIVHINIKQTCLHLKSIFHKLLTKCWEINNGNIGFQILHLIFLQAVLNFNYDRDLVSGVFYQTVVVSRRSGQLYCGTNTFQLVVIAY